MQTFLYIVLAIVVLLVMITVHEFGHYCAGKILGFKINEFAIGFGPAIFMRKNKKSGEQFSIRALPLGGYCAFEGEDEAGNDKPGAFNTMPAWKRLIVLLAGVSFNFLFGILTAAIYLMAFGYSVPKISAAKNDPNVNLKSNDIVLKVNGSKLEAYRNFSEVMSKFKADEEITITVNRDGKIVDVKAAKTKFPAYYFIADNSAFVDKLYSAGEGKISLEKFSNDIINLSLQEGDNAETSTVLKAYFADIYKDAELKEQYKPEEIDTFLKNNQIVYVAEGYTLGITYSNIAEKYGFFESIGKAFPFCFYLCGQILNALGGLITGSVPIAETGGTITAISQIAQISKQGLGYFLLLLPLLAMNLAVFNILPIPSLDGARAVFVLIELIFRKPVPRKIEGWIHTVGLFLLLGLVVVLDICHFALSCFLLL